MVFAEARLPSQAPSSEGRPSIVAPPAGPRVPARTRDKLAARLAEVLMSYADVRLDGARAWDVQVLDDRFFLEVLLRGSMGFGEAYMAGWWRCGDLEEFARRMLTSNLEERFSVLPSYLVTEVTARVTNQQSIVRSRRVADEHYSMDNDLFGRFLGRYKMYSAGYYEAGAGGGAPDPWDLDEAQRRKLELICQKLELSAADHLLDVGGGWGEFARFAAETTGCKVTSINISDEQMVFAREYCKGLPVEIVKCDYRNLTGRYTKIAAIAMIAHVGYKNLPGFMRIMRDHLEPGGLLFIESTGSTLSRTHMDPWVDKYIFKGALFPSVQQIGTAIDGLFAMDDWQNFQMSYIPTLRCWNRNFQAAWPVLAERYDESTRRMFEYFFLTGAGAFHARLLQYWHLVLTPTTRRTPGPRLT
jgi:cyclopropane-fatty-acyl-phospholipid synthase